MESRNNYISICLFFISGTQETNAHVYIIHTYIYIYIYINIYIYYIYIYIAFRFHIESWSELRAHALTTELSAQTMRCA